jgi:hypothetical protein
MSYEIGQMMTDTAEWTFANLDPSGYYDVYVHRRIVSMRGKETGGKENEWIFLSAIFFSII